MAYDEADVRRLEHGTHSAYVHARCRCDLCRDAEKEYQREYRDANRERLNAYDRRPERTTTIRDDPAKRRAREKVKAALRRGRLVRQPCESCGAKPAQAHHADYSKPLEVRWLCPPCHGIEHRR